MTLTLLHCSDLHFGRDADLAQLDGLVALAPELAPDAIVVAGDLTQRARHGEFQAALAFLARLRATAPLLACPGNHDVLWWESPFHLLGRERIYAKWRRWMGDDLTPSLRVPGATIVSLLTSHGVAAGSMTWNLNDMAVKGHLPAAEVRRAAEAFRSAPAEDVRVAVLHHNVLRGRISQRMGLSRWKQAQARLAASGADLILCGHDHEEAAAELVPGVVVATSSTHTARTRGHRPSACNVVRVTAQAIEVQHYRWEPEARRFRPSDQFAFRRRPAGEARPAHAVA